MLRNILSYISGNAKEALDDAKSHAALSKAADRIDAITSQLMPSEAKTTFQKTIQAALEASELPQIAVFATGRGGTFYKYHGGKVSSEPDARPLKEDDIFQLASQTKLITSIACLQAVERGEIALDDNVEHLIPELAEQPVLDGFDDDEKPITHKRKNPITLRILLTHSTGCTYDAADPDIMLWREVNGQPPSKGRTIPERYGYPLLFEPGTSWVYGSSIDWAGLVIMRLTKKTLEELFAEYIYKPLGIKDMTFFIQNRPDLQSRRLGVSWRTDDGGLEPTSLMDINADCDDCFGGQGLFASMSEYIKILDSIVSDDGKLLKPETRALMFTPQLDEARAKALVKVMKGPAGAFFVGEYDTEIPVNWGIGGLLFLKDGDGCRKKGTLQWSGMFNTYWIIDPTAGLALTFGTQVLMPGDRTVAKNITTVEKAIYKIAGVSVP